MTNWVEWFRYQLKASGDGFIWAFEQLPTERRLKLPPPEPRYMGKWEPLRHVWHVGEYERCQVVPSMRQWLGGSMPGEDAWLDDDHSWTQSKKRGADDIAAAFCAVRQEQIALLKQLESADWETPRETLWGMKPLKMIVTKTYQHTFEHGDTLLRMAWWWGE